MSLIDVVKRAYMYSQLVGGFVKLSLSKDNVCELDNITGKTKCFRLSVIIHFNF